MKNRKNCKEIYKWLKAQKGNVTIEQLVFEFSDSDPVEIAEGFSMFLDSQRGW